MPGSPVADIRNTFGAAFVGVFISTVLFGMTVAQTWIYFYPRHYQENKDPKTLKVFVAFLTAMDFVHTALCAYAVYWYLILNFGNVESLDLSIWALNVQVIFSAVIGASVQFFYARRVYILSQSVIVPIFIVTSMAIGFAFGILYTAKQIVLKHFSNFHSLNWISCVGLAADALANSLIAAAICWSLFSKKTGFASTDNKIMTFVVYCVNSGFLTSILGIATVISFAVSPSLISLAFSMLMCKCYVNSLLAMLNSREYARDRSTTDNPDSNSFKLSSIRLDPSSQAYGSKPAVSVTVHRSTATEFGRNKPDPDLDPAFDIAKPDASTIPYQSQDQPLEASA